MSNQNQFVVSVADAILIDEASDQIVLKAKSLLSTNLVQGVQNQEIRGGYGNMLLFDWSYQKDFQATLEDAIWSQDYLAINNGTQIISGIDKFYKQDEPVTLVGGVGEVFETPIGSVYVERPDGQIVTITPSGKTFTVAGLTNENVFVTYQYNTSIEQVVADADKFPKALKLILKSKILNSDGSIKSEFEVIVPKYKPAGSFEINLAAAEASTSSITGKALVERDSKTGNQVYYYVNFKPVSGVATSFVNIAAFPSEVELTTGNTTQPLTVIGIQGGNRANVYNPEGTTFTSADTAVATVNSAGLVTRVGAGDTTITVTNGVYTDTVYVEVV